MAVTGRWSDTVFFEQFDTVGNYTVLDSNDWEVYSADPGNAGYGVRSQGVVNVVASGEATSGSNVLRLAALNVGGEHFHSGVKLLRPKTYMQAELRVKVDVDPTTHATVEGFGAAVTGGAAGSDYTITTLADSGAGSLRDALSTGSRNITVDSSLTGTVTLLTALDVTVDDWTLDLDGRVTVTGERIRCQGADNWIIRNGKFQTATGDSLAVQNVSAGGNLSFVVTQCEFEGPNGDGGIDITQNYGATISGTICYSKFHKMDKTVLIDGNGSNEGGTYNVSIHHCLFEDNLSRQPLFQNGQCHIFQCYYYRYGTHDGNQAAATSRGVGQVRVEECAARPRDVGDVVGFNGLTTTTPRARFSERLFGETSAVHANISNSLLTSLDGNTTATELDQLAGSIFTPSYSYTTGTPDPDAITQGAGTRTGAGAGVTSGVVIFWPTANPVRFPLTTDPEGPWPSGGELDFWETFDNRDTRTPTKSYIHQRNPAATPPFTSADDQTIVEVSHTGVDQSDWHKIVCSWTPDSVYIEIDNGDPVVITDNPNLIPKWDMELTIQLDAWSDTPPDQTINMEVDYVLLRDWVPITTFPDDRLDLQLEMALDADQSASPLTWSWTDMSDRLRRIGGEPSIRLRRGRPNEGGKTSPTSISFELDNYDGAITPTGAGVPRRGTPVRLWVEGAEPALYLPGVSGAYCSTPDSADFNTTDLDVRMLIEPHQWTDANGLGANRVDQMVVTKYAGSSDRSWYAYLTDDGRLLNASWDTSNTLAGGSSPLGDYQVAGARPTWLAMTTDADNGSSLSVATTYVWPEVGTPPADVTTWDVLDETTGPVVGALQDSTAPVEIGAWQGGNISFDLTDSAGFQGRVLAIEIRDAINGTIIANPDFRTATPGDTTVTDSTGKVWTLHGSATITRSRLRAFGFIGDSELVFPAGDNNAANTSECWIRYTCAGLLRQLDQGAKPFRSALYRRSTSGTGGYSPFIHAYWPCEDGESADRLEPAGSYAADGPITWTGTIKPAADSTLPASDALPTIEADVTATWTAPLQTAAWSSFQQWNVYWVFRIPEPEVSPTSTTVMTVTTADTNVWTVEVNDSNVIVTSATAGGGTIDTDTTAITSGCFGPWVVAHLDVVRNIGGQSLFNLYLDPIDGATGVTATGNFTSTLISQPVSLGGAAVTGPPKGLSFGHITVGDYLPNDWLDNAATSWMGETATHRFRRLCEEENVPVDIVGDYLTESLGELGVSDPMGPQGRSPLLKLLQDCVDVDLGALLERPSSPGLVYRSRASLEAQTAALAVSGDANYLVGPLPFLDDDQRYRNEVTVRSAGGTEATVIDTDGQAAAGRYDTSITINGMGGVGPGLADRTGLDFFVSNQNSRQAERRLYIASWDGLRCPHLTVRWHLGTETLIEAWQATALGDRVTLDDLPSQLPSSTVDLLVEAIEETLTPTKWTVDLTCSPGGPWSTPYGVGLAAAPTAELTTTSLARIETGTPEVSAVNSATGTAGASGHTVTNPINGTGGTLLFITVAPGPSESSSGSYTAPTGATQQFDYAGVAFVPRVRCWTKTEAGETNFTFGWSDTADAQTCIIVGLDSAASAVAVTSTPSVGVSTSMGYPTLATTVDDLTLAISAQQSTDELTAGPAGYSSEFNNTSGSPRRAAVYSAIAAGASTTPGNSTWDGTVGAKVQLVISFTGS